MVFGQLQFSDTDIDEDYDTENLVQNDPSDSPKRLLFNSPNLLFTDGENSDYDHDSEDNSCPQTAPSYDSSSDDTLQPVEAISGSDSSSNDSEIDESNGLVVHPSLAAKHVTDQATFRSPHSVRSALPLVTPGWVLEAVCDDRVRMHEKSTKRSYLVYRSRLNKAMEKLPIEECASALLPKNCRCKRLCFSHCTTTIVQNWREKILQLPSEESVSEFIVNYLRTVGVTELDEPIIVGGKQMCREFFASMLGVSTYKIRAAKKAACGNISIKRKKRMRPKTMSKQHIAISFWKHFFQRCQRPNKTTRLFPNNLSMPVIYKRYFKPWFAKSYPEATNKARPFLPTVKKARWTNDFKDVVKRKNHTHCRCSDCYTLEARSKRGFASLDEERQWENDSDLHTQAVEHFRECETDWQVRAAHAPEKVNLFSFDDTGSLKLPHFSNRQPKNLPSARLELIPFLIEDHARGKKTYIYSTKGRYGKGANRICGQLYAAIEALKNDTSHVAHLARTLCLICDNFSENKNNTLFEMCSELDCQWMVRRSTTAVWPSGPYSQRN